MITGISASYLSFKANESTVRDSFNAKIDENTRMTQRQNGIVLGMINPANPSQMNNQIPMQGGQKLDVIA